MNNAVTPLDDAAHVDPDDHRLRLDQAKLPAGQGRLDAALTLLEGLPTKAADDPEVDLLRTHLELIRTAQTGPDTAVLQKRIADTPNDHAARFQLAAQRLLADDYVGALRQFTTIVTGAAGTERERARRALLATLALLGPDRPLAPQFREAIRLDSH